METQDTAEQLIETLSSCSDSGRIYTLVDPAHSPQRRLTLEELDACIQLAHPFISQPRDQRLYLQPFNRKAESLRQVLSRERESLPDKRTGHVAFCGWVLCRCTPHALNSHMEKQLTVSSPEGNTAMLRYYDPRVMERLEVILEPKQMAHLLGPIEHWFYFDHRKRLRQISRPTAEMHLGKLTLSSEQWSAIKRIGQVNLYWDKWDEFKMGSKPDITPAHIDALIEASQRIGLEDDKDRYFFVMHGLVNGQRFHEHPLIQSILERMTASESYVSLTDGLKSSDWEQVKEETGRWPQ
ncbi:hypothetical protein HCU01_42770 [Halomonas cupida]|uniref:DUF4123 domain-containing protein n=1 Tax=Halomonas cupida TaxID=44933 RepID=A0A1M7N1P9_9GAMM|nr:DUF4123 domain-containing protein [Halomonas cupida]GEN26328.1 hypothetical protein HCU01_42770 [Halomonas cupida]SHM96891.1 protein of unknown function [Halomonas cupida]